MTTSAGNTQQFGQSGMMSKIAPPPGLEQVLSQPAKLDACTCRVPPPPGLTRGIREVWNWNFQEEFQAFLEVARNVGAKAVIAFDTEFPGALCQDTRFVEENKQYNMLRESVNLLRPIQIGFAVASPDGTLHGVWNFNLLFNVEFDLHMESSVHFLQRAGVDFRRHAAEGVQPQMLGQHLAKSVFVSSPAGAPLWVAFSGFYDFGYLLNILSDRPLPQALHAYNEALETVCARRFDLRDRLPLGSLEDLVRMHDMERSGAAHTAGSDALSTLDLFFHVAESTDVHAGLASDNGLSVCIAGMTVADQLAVAMEGSDQPVEAKAPPPSWGASARCAMVGAMAPWKRVRSIASHHSADAGVAAAAAA